MRLRNNVEYYESHKNDGTVARLIGLFDDLVSIDKDAIGAKIGGKLGIATGVDTSINATLEVGGQVSLNGNDEVRAYFRMDRTTLQGANGAWALNTNTNIAAGKRLGGAYGIEIDLNNNDSDVAFTANAADQAIGLQLTSGGPFKPLAAIAIQSTVAAGRWLAGVLVSNWSSYGIRITQDAAAPAVTGPALYLVPSTDGVNALVTLKNAAQSATTLTITQSGFLGLNVAPAKRLHVYAAANDVEILAGFENDQAGTGTAALAFSVSNSGSEAKSFKAGIGFTRSGSNGRGSIDFFNRSADDGNDFAAPDIVASLLNSGDLQLKAGVLDTKTGGSTVISTGVGSIRMSTASAATNAAWIPQRYNGVLYYVPGWTTNAP